MYSEGRAHGVSLQVDKWLRRRSPPLCSTGMHAAIMLPLVGPAEQQGMIEDLQYCVLNVAG